MSGQYGFAFSVSVSTDMGITSGGLVGKILKRESINYLLIIQHGEMNEIDNTIITNKV